MNVTTEIVVFPWTYLALLMWRDLQAWFTRVDWMLVFGAILIFGTITIFWKLSRSKSKFDFADAFAGENGKTSMAKVLMFCAGLAAIWLMVSLKLSNQMTEGYFTTFLLSFVLQKAATEGIGVLRQAQIARTAEAQGSNGADPDPAQPVGTIDVSVPLSVKPGSAATVDRGPPYGKRRS